MQSMNRTSGNKSAQTRLNIVISGIGTGGHYFPAIVVALEILRRRHRVTFLVRKGFAEESIARSYGLRVFHISPRQFYGKSIVYKVLAAYSFALSIIRLGPVTTGSIGLSCGGFGSLPLIIACLLKRRPFYLFEPNCIPGRATRMFSRYARMIFMGMPSAAPLKGKQLMTGIPIRKEFKAVSDRKGGSSKTVLFMGGSGGAKKLNELALTLQGIAGDRFRIVIISGKRDYDWVNASKGTGTRVIAFTTSPWNEINDADIVISRSGALAGYEIMALGRKAIFIPFPFAIDDHQRHNARYFARLGSAEVLDERNASPDVLLRKIVDLLRASGDKNPRVILDAERRIADMIEASDPRGGA
jgi:UDP-N-acetylglucosamine--N-acetylmuramyl-(pentapeptide) pyrophosphoryl-undecaprenol N-acetylglucosamine transferase